MEERYVRNFDALTPGEFERLRGSRVLVAGCGGLGGYLVELLARLGVGQLTVADGDVFQRSDLNRQLLSAEALLGQGKARAAADRVRAVNGTVRVLPVEEYLTEDSAEALAAGHDLVADALDSAADRLMLAGACGRAGVPLVHGAVCGWNAQVSTVLPGDGTMERIYVNQPAEDRTILSFTPALCASLQAAEAVRLLTGQPPLLAGKLLLADLRFMDWQIVSI